MKKTDRRKWLWLLPLLLFSLAFKAPKDVTIYMNGEIISTDQPPVIKNSRTFVPVRVIAENLGAQVFYLKMKKPSPSKKATSRSIFPSERKRYGSVRQRWRGPCP